MAIITTYPAFRWYACEKIVSSPLATFNVLAPDTITRTDGVSYITDGIEAGMVTRPSGTANNDGFLYTVESLIATTLTLDVGDAVVAEGPIACTLTSYWLDRDGYEEFPGPFGHTNLVRSGGFSGGFADIPQPWAGVQFSTSVNAWTADAVPGVDEYNWYLSQRTDDPAKQYIEITQYANPLFPGNTYSGTVKIDDTALAASELGISLPVTPTQISEVFKHCDLYCIRVADGAIQWANLLEEMFQVTR